MTIPFPASELAVIDLTVRMFTQPALQADINLLGEIWTDEARRKQEMLAALDVTPADLQSAERFAALLCAEGIEPETKNGKNAPIYAFAKTDEFMRELLEHDDERIRTLAEARLSLKSTLNQTRAERIGFMAQRGCGLPVYLNYCGTHTTLWSGGDGINWQNFPRGSRLRRALQAPPGYLLGKVDQSQVQCRLVNYLANQEDVLERFRRRDDPYVGIASMAYGERVYKAAPDDPRYDEMLAKRGTGKQLELSCGFGAGAATIVATAAKGSYGPPVTIDLETGTRWRDLYRSTHPLVVQLWRDADRILSKMVEGVEATWLGILSVQGNTIVLPNGAPMHWPELQWDPEWQSYKFLVKRHHWKRIWGGFLVQNIVSGLASTLVRQAMLRLHAMNFKIVLQEHDAVGVLIPDDVDKDKNLDKVISEMRRSPDWALDLPLDAEGTLGKTYS